MSQNQAEPFIVYALLKKFKKNFFRINSALAIFAPLFNQESHASIS